MYNIHRVRQTPTKDSNNKEMNKISRNGANLQTNLTVKIERCTFHQPTQR